MNTSAATLKEIAAAAGCSPRAAAAVLNPSNGTVRVGKATHQRVLDIAQELGYRRNEFARAMSIGQSHVIGLLTSESSSETISRIMGGALDEAVAQGYVTKILRLPYDAAPEQVSEGVQLCSTWRLDGVVALGLRQDVLACFTREIKHSPRPVAYIESFPENENAICVSSDDVAGIRAALSHLVSLGHERIALLSGDVDSSVSQLRARIFLATLHEMGLPADPQYVVLSNWGDVEIIERAAEQLLDLKPRPTAVLCAADAIAMVTLRLARRRGLALPSQLSVIGYGDSHFAVYADPALTTIAQPFHDMGRIAVQRLLAHIAARKAGEATVASCDVVPEELIIRDSTAAPA
ncbi:MAG TPA: LacI family DNA-binding transcriptional regulator [Abditibacteriaceae bacterium]|jgi:DNA-binding LacI/PurR family transcriptional regulator